MSDMNLEYNYLKTLPKDLLIDIICRIEKDTTNSLINKIREKNKKLFICDCLSIIAGTNKCYMCNKIEYKCKEKTCKNFLQTFILVECDECRYFICFCSNCYLSIPKTQIRRCHHCQIDNLFNQ